MFDLFKAIGLGLAVLLPLANPLTTVALFLGLAGNMNNAERNKQALMASVYVFAILMVSWYAGQVVMNTFGISIPGLRIAGGLIVAFIGFRMLFPQQKAHDSMEAKIKSEELQDEPTANIAFVPLAMPSTAGPGTIAMIISSASTVKHGVDFPEWVVLAAPPIIFLLLGVILWACLRSSGAIMRLVGKGGIEAISRLMGFLLVCMGVQFIINGVLEIISTWHPDRPRCAEKKSPPARYRRAFLCDGFRSGAADGLPAIPASDGISSATRPARPAPEWRRRSRRRPWKDADSPGCRPAPRRLCRY